MTHDAMVSDAGPIIMVDDNESDAYLAKKCYEHSKLGNEFVVLDSGTELLEYLAQVRDGKKLVPVHVLLDINMPGMSGLEALAKIRQLPDFEATPTITMLTNSDDPRDAERSTALGADSFVTKPADISDYIAFFDSLASRPYRA